ncbi:hypothetical protein B0H14DRAFT_3881988 [Mycena olivaceomarginata]|nr:hypothetical protein B0H14DRAFT_3881988 [Mycena olivaceomarginata]
MVAIHLALLAVWAFRLELRLVFALQNQNTVSSFIAATATTFGTVYSAVLVFLTQTPSYATEPTNTTNAHRDARLCRYMGWHRLCISAALAATGGPEVSQSILVYLSTISALHITTSTLFFLDTFNSSQTVNIPTRGLPAYSYFG